MATPAAPALVGFLKTIDANYLNTGFVRRAEKIGNGATGYVYWGATGDKLGESANPICDASMYAVGYVPALPGAVATVIHVNNTGTVEPQISDVTTAQVSIVAWAVRGQGDARPVFVPPVDPASYWLTAPDNTLFQPDGPLGPVANAGSAAAVVLAAAQAAWTAAHVVQQGTTSV